MIPKKIHYCWFGNKPLDTKALNCIASWKRFFPEYEIIRWDESNYDVNRKDFTRKAYADKKWAFVSDVARLEIVYQNGGIYFDTDVEVLRDFNDIIDESPSGFMGIDHQLYVNTGLGFGAEKGSPILGLHLDMYENIDYDEYKNNLSQIACPVLTNKLLNNKGIVIKNKIQQVMDITIYPHDYFNPLDYLSGKVERTPNTHSIHWYNDSWNSDKGKKNKHRLQKFRFCFGIKYGEWLYGIYSSIEKEGLFSYVNKRLIKKKRGRKRCE